VKSGGGVGCGDVDRREGVGLKRAPLYLLIDINFLGGEVKKEK
jgi:hypothetical protein